MYKEKPWLKEENGWLWLGVGVGGFKPASQRKRDLSWILKANMWAFQMESCTCAGMKAWRSSMLWRTVGGLEHRVGEGMAGDEVGGVGQTQSLVGLWCPAKEWPLHPKGTKEPLMGFKWGQFEFRAVILKANRLNNWKWQWGWNWSKSVQQGREYCKGPPERSWQYPSLTPCLFNMTKVL